MEKLCVAFRCDASLVIGSGHVMRCLALADALAERGVLCSFITRKLPGNIVARIAEHGHKIELLETPQVVQSELARPTGPHNQWLGVTMEQEVEQSGEAIGRLDPDMVVVDHYALDHIWHQQVCAGRTVVAIDDLADRQHDCKLLLDQNFGRQSTDYDDLVPPKAERLIGPKYALLRPEFRAKRQASLARRQSALDRIHILVSMGGADQENSTGRILDAMSRSSHIKRIDATVVMGSAAPHLQSVREQAKEMPFPTTVLSNVGDMASLLVDVDMAIGAAGGSVWERCCLGVPSLLLTIAENQRPAASALDAAGIGISLGDLDVNGWQEELEAGLGLLLNAGAMGKMSAAAAQLVDGYGADRVASEVIALLMVARTVSESDAREIWEWRHAGGGARFYLSGQETPFHEHLEWLQDAIKDKRRHLLIVELNGVPVGHIRFDLGDEMGSTATVSITMSPKFRGQKLAQATLIAGIKVAEFQDIELLHAAVHRENQASRRLFQSCGFREAGRDKEFIMLTKDLGRFEEALNGTSVE